ncbi:hypothetical protein SAMN02745129_2901 [Ferrimonas marina]|uniref:Uncharacterized protein n=1 Tax=Ferrimonas marina TaxID=299255 RepID=A0A1M5VPJ9_9GAMM|nr:hypothetical protein SAMN02745129_2901 [Ferrimonas marina]
MLLLGLAGCASQPSVDPATQNPDKQQAQIDAVWSRIDALEGPLQDEELAWFATAQMRRANSTWQDARQQYQLYAQTPERMYERLGVFSTRSRYQASQESLEDAEKLVQQAQEIRDQAKEQLAEPFHNREVLRSLDAQSLHSTTYQQLDEQLKSLVDNIASGRLSRALSAQPALLKAQRELEVRTVRDIYLTPHRRELERQKNEGLDQTAPASYEQASQRLEAAWKHVEAFPRDLDTVAAQAEATRFALAHSRHLGQDLQSLDKADRAERESYLLGLETQLAQLSHSLGMEDLRDRPLKQQLKELNKVLQKQMRQPEAGLVEPEADPDEQDGEEAALAEQEQ